MGREPERKTDDTMLPNGGPEATEDDLSDIDPADFFDPEEFGTKQPA